MTLYTNTFTIFQTEGFTIYVDVTEITPQTENHLKYNIKRSFRWDFYIQKTDDDFGNSTNSIEYQVLNLTDYQTLTFTNSVTGRINIGSWVSTLDVGIDGFSDLRGMFLLKTSNWITENNVTNLTPQQMYDLQNDIVWKVKVPLDKYDTYVASFFNPKYEDDTHGTIIFYPTNALYIDANTDITIPTLDTTNYDYELSYSFDYDFTNLYTAISKGNVTEGINTIFVNSSNMTQEQYNFYTNENHANRYVFSVNLRLTQYEKNTTNVIDYTQIRFNGSDPSYNGRVTMVSFRDNKHTNNRLPEEYRTYYNQTFDATSDFITNISDMSFSFIYSTGDSDRYIDSVKLIYDNVETTINFNGTHNTELCRFDSTSLSNFNFTNLENVVCPEYLLKYVSVEIHTTKIINRVPSWETKKHYFILRLIPYTDGYIKKFVVQRSNAIGNYDPNGAFFNVYYVIDTISCALNKPPFTDSNMLSSLDVSIDGNIHHIDCDNPINDFKSYYTSTWDNIVTATSGLTSHNIRVYFKKTLFDRIARFENFIVSKPILNFKSDGYGIGIGKEATINDTLDIGFDVIQREGTHYQNVDNTSYCIEHVNRTDSQTVYRNEGNNLCYPKGYKIEHPIETDSHTFIMTDTIRNDFPILTYATHDTQTNNNVGSNNVVNGNFGFVMSTPLFFDAHLDNTINTKSIYDRNVNPTVYDYNTGAQSIFHSTSGSKSFIDSMYFYKWGCIAQFYITFEATQNIGQGDITDLKLGEILLDNWKPVMLTALGGGDWGSVINGVLLPNGNFYLCSTHDTISSGSKFTLSATYFTRFDIKTDHQPY